MLDKREFQGIKKDLERFEETRERVISQSREIITISKQVIYSLHRGDKKRAGELVKAIKDRVKKLPKEPYDAGIQRVACQEYVEAAAFYELMTKGEMPGRKSLGIGTEDYLMGICDLTGELVRKAVNSVIKGDNKEAIKIKDLVEEIYGEFLKFDLRNGELRKKSDSIKWNLNKLEEIAYNIKLKR